MNRITEILTFLYALARLNYIKIWRYYSSTAKIVVWVTLPVKRILRPDVGIIYDLMYIKYLSENNIFFKVVFDKNIGRVHHSNVLVNLSRVFNRHGFEDWGQVIEDKIKLLEMQGCKVGPNSHEAKFWEDKITMHNEFKKFGVVTPATKTIYNVAGLQEELLKNLGSSAEFGKMNRIQQQSLAAAFGMQIDDVTKLLLAQEKLVELGISQNKLDQIQQMNAEQLASEMRTTTSESLS